MTTDKIAPADDPIAAAIAAAARTASGEEPDWVVPTTDMQNRQAEQFADEHGLDTLVSRKLVQRSGWMDDQIDFYNAKPRFVVHPDNTVPGMRDAAAEVGDALQGGQKIAIFADYDPDGTCAAEALRMALAPYAADDQLQFIYADAQRGFGLHQDAIAEASRFGATMLVTLDCGSAQSAAAQAAIDAGLRVIVVDHHESDPANPAHHHLNPRLEHDRVALPLRQAEERVANAKIATDHLFDERGKSKAKLRALNEELELVSASLRSSKSRQRKADLLEEIAAAERTGEEIEAKIAALDPDLVAEYRAASKELTAARQQNKFVKPTSENTGAQLAWKFGAAIQRHLRGRVRPEMWGRAMYVAGIGAIADRAAVADPENRAFILSALRNAGHGLEGDEAKAAMREVVPPGVRLLADELGEDPTRPGGMIRTRACMNTPKRTRLVSAAWVGELLAAETEEEARPIVDQLIEGYNRAAEARKEMLRLADEQLAAQDGERVVVVTIDHPDLREYAGYTGQVAATLSKRAGRPVLLFARKPTEHGVESFKFSIRRDAPAGRGVGAMISDVRMRELCTTPQVTDSGEVLDLPSIGGHPSKDVVSGQCLASNVEQIVATVRSWADGVRQWEPEERPKRSLYVDERQVEPTRIAKIIKDSRELGPYDYKEHFPASFSVYGEIGDLRPDPDSQRHFATLTCDDGSVWEIAFGAKLLSEHGAPPPGRLEVVLQAGESGPMPVRAWHPPTVDHDTSII